MVPVVGLPAPARPSAQHKPSPPPLPSYDAGGARNVRRGRRKNSRRGARRGPPRAEAYVTPPYEPGAGGQARGSTACGTEAPPGEFLQLNRGAYGSSAGRARAERVSFLGPGRKELDTWVGVGRMMERPRPSAQHLQHTQRETP
ncbi:hypothetical protein ACE1SV_39380 [Streptomyces sennicomposti]